MDSTGFPISVIYERDLKSTDDSLSRTSCRVGTKRMRRALLSKNFATPTPKSEMTTAYPEVYCPSTQEQLRRVSEKVSIQAATSAFQNSENMATTLRRRC
jgi:hypothetical protein